MPCHSLHRRLAERLEQFERGGVALTRFSVVALHQCQGTELTENNTFTALITADCLLNLQRLLIRRPRRAIFALISQYIPKLGQHYTALTCEAFLLGLLC